MKFKDVDLAFANLLASEKKGFGEGVPRLKPANQALDLAFLKGKLRLHCRRLLYAAQTSPQALEIGEEDAAEAFALLERKKEYLGLDQGLFLYTNVLDFLSRRPSEVSVEDLQNYLRVYDLHAGDCSLEEQIELLMMASSYCISLTNIGRKEFGIDSLLILARTVGLRYSNDGVKEEGYLSASVFRCLTIAVLLMIPRNRLPEINHVVKWPAHKTNFTVKEWSLRFSRIYSPFLDPKIRKPYQQNLKAAILFQEEEYLKAFKIFRELRFPDSQILSLSPLRFSYCCVFSMHYHGTTAERKFLRRNNLRPSVILERFRKRVAYQKKKLEGEWAILLRHEVALERMQAIHKAYELANRSDSPEKVWAKIEEYLLVVRESLLKGGLAMEKPWMQTQLELLEKRCKSGSRLSL
ncbi:hypothetical protein [Neolewinella agarilytica]|uniref:hypothetical protein n=1 Tax=Neolewinella agarilytica TaxID=478744 RepID=UPI002356EA77|nr:hypothetical protein [Neolewinella agarilytica]